jgi:hypothetical protein
MSRGYNQPPILPTPIFNRPPADLLPSQFHSMDTDYPPAPTLFSPSLSPAPFVFAQYTPPFQLYLTSAQISYLQEQYPASVPGSFSSSPFAPPLPSTFPMVKRRRLDNRTRYY